MRLSISGMLEGLKIWRGGTRSNVGGHNLPPLFEIGLNDLPKIGSGRTYAPPPKLQPPASGIPEYTVYTPRLDSMQCSLSLLTHQFLQTNGNFKVIHPSILLPIINSLRRWPYCRQEKTKKLLVSKAAQVYNMKIQDS